LLFYKLKFKAGLALTAALVVVGILAPGSASAKCVTGGLTPAAIDICTPTANAKLLPTGELIPPKSAPPRVAAVIEAANKIRTKPYIYGGGHGRWWDAGYDCSGAVSFALHGGSLITTPMPSGSLAGWGSGGKGRWITVYANGGHAYAIIAGLRWDTAGTTNGTGPRWHKSLRAQATGPFTARHPDGY
jgi:hypothetical protein